MHPSVIRDRLIVAQQEIVEISEELAEQLGIDGLKPIPVDARDENERIMHRYESVVEFMNRAVVAAAEEGDDMSTSERERRTVGDTPPVGIDNPPDEPVVEEPTVETPEAPEDQPVGIDNPPEEEDVEDEEAEGEVEEEEEEEEEEAEDTEIDALPLTQTAKTALYDAGVHRLDQVRAMSDDDLKAIQGVGARTIEVLRKSAG